jgi:hypothetical protein|tara:strand:+ start:730 stop:939 length:210 start_codon:yes stop_codon:yes gene_type:complete
MNKLNGFERFCIHSALEQWITEQETHAVEMEKAGKRYIIAPGYWTMVGKDLEQKVNILTYKKDLENAKY